MACTPSHCNSNCYSDTCAGNMVKCPTNASIFGSDVVTGVNIALASHINDLRISVDDERVNRRGYTADFPTLVDSDDLVDEQHFEDLRDSINEMVGQTGDDTTVTITDTYTGTISASEMNNLRTKINELRVDCVCDSDCGANSVCSCHGNCGNNYSDEKLKKEIEYL